MTLLGRKKTESNCLPNFPRTISQTSSLFRQSQHKRKIRDKKKGIVDKCSDLTCTKKYALTEGRKWGVRVNVGHSLSPQVILCLLGGCVNAITPKERNRLHKLASAHNNSSNWDAYQHARNKVVHMIRSAKRVLSQCNQEQP